MSNVKTEYLNILNDSFEYLIEHASDDNRYNKLASKGKLAFLSQAIFGYAVVDERIASLMVHQTILIIQMIQKGEHFEQFEQSDLKKMIASFILNTSFFFNIIPHIGKALLLTNPTIAKWRPPYPKSNYVLDMKTFSTPFIMRDHPGNADVLYIPEKEWDDFLNAMIEFAQDEFDAITCSFSLLH